MDLKAHLKAHKIKIQDLAHALGVDASFISRVLAGQRKLEAQQFAKLAKYFSLPLTDLQAYFLSVEVRKLLAPYPKCTSAWWAYIRLSMVMGAPLGWAWILSYYKTATPSLTSKATQPRTHRFLPTVPQRCQKVLEGAFGVGGVICI